MARHIRKGDLPQRVCASCARSFVWRKKGAKVWEDVKYCSDGCRAASAAARRGNLQKI